MRILVILGLIVLGAGFIYFAANVIFLGTKAFFKIYGNKLSNNVDKAEVKEIKK